MWPIIIIIIIIIVIIITIHMMYIYIYIYIEREREREIDWSMSARRGAVQSETIERTAASWASGSAGSSSPRGRLLQGQKIAQQKSTPQRSSRTFSGMFQHNFTWQWYFPTDCHLSSDLLLEMSNGLSVAFFNGIFCPERLSAPERRAATRYGNLGTEPVEHASPVEHPSGQRLV